MMRLLMRMLVACGMILGIYGGVAAQPANQGSCPDSLFSSQSVMNGVVTPGSANNVRSEPSANAALLGQIAPGQPFNVSYAPPVCAEGYLWLQVRTPTLEGWTVEVPAGGGEPFVVPYVPGAQDVGQINTDGSIQVQTSGIAFTVPAGLNIARVTMTPQVGIFGNVMGARNSSVAFTLIDAAGEARGSIEIYPYARSSNGDDISPELEQVLNEQPSLLQYAASGRMPQYPISGAAALIGGAGAYVPFGSGNGLRYITYFAQNSVIFTSETVFEYVYRGITADQAFLVAAQGIPVIAPANALPPPVSSQTADFSGYWRQFEANLAVQPTSAFTPDLGLIDAVFGSLTITDNQALLKLIP